MSKPRYIQWGEVFARDAPFNLIIARRELGKSFGAREQVLRDYKSNGERAVAVVRYKDDIQLAISDYFGDVAEKTSDGSLRAWLEHMEFNYAGNSIKIRQKSDGKQKGKWDEILRMIPLSKATRYKQATMHNLRRVLFDEALIDRSIDSYTRYLPNEYRLLQNLIGTLQRYADKDSQGRPRLRVYLMGNAVDLVNPYFAALHIEEQPPFGGRWFMGKQWFFYYPDPSKFEAKAKSAQMAERMAESASDYGNQFAASARDFVAKKPSSAVFDFGVAYRGDVFGVWLDIKSGTYYVNTKVPKNTTMPIYALSTQDNKPNYIVAKSANKTLKGLTELYCYGIVRFDKPATRERFNGVLALFGVR